MQRYEYVVHRIHGEKSNTIRIGGGSFLEGNTRVLNICRGHDNNDLCILFGPRGERRLRLLKLSSDIVDAADTERTVNLAGRPNRLRRLLARTGEFPGVRKRVRNKCAQLPTQAAGNRVGDINAVGSVAETRVDDAGRPANEGVVIAAYFQRDRLAIKAEDRIDVRIFSGDALNLRWSLGGGDKNRCLFHCMNTSVSGLRKAVMRAESDSTRSWTPPALGVGNRSFWQSHRPSMTNNVFGGATIVASN